MDNQELYGRSEWNEQMYFSSLYFTLHTHCRTYQSSGDLIGWKNALESKMSTIMGILDDAETTYVFNLRKNVQKIFFKFSMIPDSRNTSRDKAYVSAMLNNTLFETEAIIDKMTHKHMPFLKTRPEVDITAF